MKKILHAGIIGQQGINLIERVTLDMGFLWHPTGLEAGIDGYIEIRNASSGEVTNCILQVQSRATEQRFQNDRGSTFDYICSEKDLDYWLAGNAPVILVCSRPKSGEAYWIFLREYFKDLAKRKAEESPSTRIAIASTYQPKARLSIWRFHQTLAFTWGQSQSTRSFTLTFSNWHSSRNTIS